jgi:hypothetical protein
MSSHSDMLLAYTGGCIHLAGRLCATKAPPRAVWRRSLHTSLLFSLRPVLLRFATATVRESITPGFTRTSLQLPPTKSAKLYVLHVGWVFITLSFAFSSHWRPCALIISIIILLPE